MDDLDVRDRLHRLYGAAQTGEGAGADASAQGQWLLAIKGWLEAKGSSFRPTSRYNLRVFQCLSDKLHDQVADAHVGEMCLDRELADHVVRQRQIDLPAARVQNGPYRSGS